jgi:parallel beta-helix repeat protein
MALQRGPALTVRSIGRRLYPLLAIETAASATPTAYGYAYGNVRRYGADPAASAATNTSAIQKAIDVAELGGAAVYIPAGTYSITQVTHDSTNGITICGDGYQSCLQGVLNGTAIMILVQHAAFTAINGFKLSGVRFDSNGGGQLDAGVVQLNNAVGFVMSDCWVENATRVSGSSGIGGIVSSVGSAGNQGPAGAIRNCVVTNTSKGAINCTSEAVGVIVDGCTIFGITGNGFAPGIQINGAFGSRVVNNLIHDTQGRGIYMATDSISNPPSDTIIANNVIYNTGTGTNEGDGIVLTRSFGTPSGRIIIANNRIRNAGVGLSSYGIYLAQDAHVTVIGNHISACKLYGLRMQTCTDVTITGNTFDANNTSNTAGVAGIYIDGTCDRVTIVGNTSTDSSASPKQAYGLELAASGVFSRFTIADNNFFGNVTNHILVSAVPKQSTLKFVAEKQTTDGSAATLQVFVLPDLTTLSVAFRVVSEQSDASNSAAHFSVAAFRRSGGGAALLGTKQDYVTALKTDATWGNTASGVASNSAILQITGKAATTINHRAQIDAQTV